MRVQIEETMPELDEEKAGSEIEEKSHRTMFHELLQSDLPAQENSVKRLSSEAQVIMCAGKDHKIS